MEGRSVSENSGALQRMQRLMEEEIPLARAGGFRLREVSADRVRLWGPYEKNTNHHRTVFGGSISTAQILCGWVMAQSLLNRIDPAGTIVIERHTTEFLSPLRKDFIACCTGPDNVEVERIKRELKQSGRSRLELQVVLYPEEGTREAARFSGVYYMRG